MDRAKQIEDLRQRASDLDEQIAVLRDRRGEFALGAVENDKTAIRAVEEIDREIHCLKQTRQTCTDAADQVERLLAEQEREAAVKDRQHREGEARVFSTQVLNVNSEIDAVMTTLCGLLEKRADLLHKLGATGAIDRAFVLRLSQKHGPTAAAHAAGLRKFLDLGHVPPQHIVPLVEGNRALKRQPTDSGQRAA